MIIRSKLPVDTSFCIDIDVEPWILWGELPPEHVVKIMELSNPCGFMIYKFDGRSVVLLKLCVREDLWRTGLGREALKWLIDRTRKRGYVGVECTLTEEQMFEGGSPTPMVYLLQDCGFEGRVIRDKYVFKRAVVCG